MTASCTRAAAGLPALLWALLCAVPAWAAGPTVKMVPGDGDLMQDIAVVEAQATTDDPEGIQKVEFLVDGTLKATDTSTPYTLDWDTLEVAEGEHTITARAYDTMRTATATVRLRVNNDLARGAPYHADAALRAASQGDTAGAIRAARRALKLEPGSVAAARAVAAVRRSERNVPAAISALEAASIPPGDVEARGELIALYMNVAAEAAGHDAIISSARKAIEVHRARAAAYAAGAGGDARLEAAAIARGDAHFALCEWKAAIDEYQKLGTPDVMPLEAANRLILAYVQAGRGKDADKLIRALKSADRADAVTPTVTAYHLLTAHRPQEARALLEPGVNDGVLPALILAGYTELTLENRRAAVKAITAAHEKAPDLPAVKLLHFYVLADPAEARQQIFDALAVNPMVPQAYAVLGFQALLSKEKDHYRMADALLAFAVSLDPSNQLAVMGQVLSALAQDRPEEAEPLLARLRELDPVGPDVNAVHAYYYSMKDEQPKVTEELKAAMKTDPDRWAYFMLPKAPELIRDVFHYRHSPLLTPAALYPAN